MRPSNTAQTEAIKLLGLAVDNINEQTIGRAWRAQVCLSSGVPQLSHLA